MKGLEDYPAVPNTPPPLEKSEKSVNNLENELNQERIYLDALAKENKELEKIINNLDKELAYVKSSFPQNIEEGVIKADNENWFKYQSQRESNRKLEKEKKHLEAEIKQIEEQGVVNLDSLTQSELILYVKQLERNKTDLTSELRASEWSLDKQAKESHHLEQLRTALDAEIRHYDEELAMFRHYNKTSCPSATSRSAQSAISLSSLDKRAVSPTPGFQRRSLKGAIGESHRVIDPKRGPINKKHAIGNLPSLKKNQPEIVVTDTTQNQEPSISLKTPIVINPGPLDLQAARNFENSPPPRPPSAGFTFDDDVIRAPVAEVSDSGDITVRLGQGNSLIIRIVDSTGVCPTCRKCIKEK